MLKSDTVITALLAECPGFAKLADIDDGPYSVLGDFAIYLRDGITKDTLRADEIERAFTFLNRMGASDDLEVQNQLVVGVLEILTDTDESLSEAKSRLEDQALKLLDRTLLGWSSA